MMPHIHVLFNFHIHSHLLNCILFKVFQMIARFLMVCRIWVDHQDPASVTGLCHLVANTVLEPSQKNAVEVKVVFSDAWNTKTFWVLYGHPLFPACFEPSYLISSFVSWCQCQHALLPHSSLISKQKAVCLRETMNLSFASESTLALHLAELVFSHDDSFDLLNSHYFPLSSMTSTALSGYLRSCSKLTSEAYLPMFADTKTTCSFLSSQCVHDTICSQVSRNIIPEFEKKTNIFKQRASL